MYKELDKYKTGKKVDAIGVIVNHGNKEIAIKLDEYECELGDLMNDFINHKNKPFWRRKYYHSHLTDLYIKMLNQIKIKTGL